MNKVNKSKYISSKSYIKPVIGLSSRISGRNSCVKSAVNSSFEGTNVVNNTEKTDNSLYEYYDDEKATVGKTHAQIKHIISKFKD